jgi:hypothetical protein
MAYDDYALNYAVSAAQSAASERAAFIRRVYSHVAGAVLAFIGVEALLLNVLDHRTIVQVMLGRPWAWLIVLGLFMGAGVLARVWAQSRSSPAMQYMGLALYIVAEAIIFMPLLILANHMAPDSNVIPHAALLTGCVFGGLTTAVFVTKKDFSFLRSILCMGSWIALGVIVSAILFHFTLGLLFSFLMVALISGYILYDTSNVMLHYPTDMHVAAALELFADVAILFWYILQILLQTQNRD